jgi:hypothetical protein
LDEVIHSLLLCLLEKRSFQESLFWISELYYSKFYDLLWKFLWQTYYDFYAINNPKFENFITKCNNKWMKNNQIEHIIDVVNLLYYSNSITNNVFYFRIIHPKLPTKIYRGRNPKWLKAFKSMNLTKPEKCFLRSLDDGDLNNIKFYFNQIKNDYQRCLLFIKQYFTTKHTLTLNEKSLITIPYENKQHIVLAIICYLFNDINNINKRLIKRKIKSDDIDFIKQTNTPNTPNTPIYKILPQKRIFGINPNIGYFENNRMKNHNTALWHYWEYFTQGCPLWDDRFIQYKCTFNDKTKEPMWDDDDILEKFYEKFGYEPDEQNKECQNKSLHELTNTSINTDVLDLLKNLKNKCYLDRVSQSTNKKN